VDAESTPSDDGPNLDGGVATSSFGMSVGRLEAFSDGVLAIVITLLILDIHVPGRGERDLAAELADQWPEYVGYLLSFITVGIVWLNHHAVINILRQTNHTLQSLNLVLLLPLTVLPWPTALLAEYAGGTIGQQRLVVVVYGVTISLMAFAFNVLWRYVLRHPELWKPQITRDMLEVRNRRFNLGPVIYPLATVVGLLNAYLFLGLMLALGTLYLLPTPEVRGS
jgi:uncharacterized membrane protein